MSQESQSRMTPQEIAEAAQIYKNPHGTRICPLSGKPITDPRCAGQYELRMIVRKGQCQGQCHPLMDDLVIKSYGGRSSTEIPELPEKE
jgi:hypothetical protein